MKGVWHPLVTVRCLEKQTRDHPAMPFPFVAWQGSVLRYCFVRAAKLIGLTKNRRMPADERRICSFCFVSLYPHMVFPGSFAKLEAQQNRYFARILPYRKNKVLDQDNYTAVLFLLWR